MSSPDPSLPPASPQTWLRRLWSWRRDVTLKKLYANTIMLFSGRAFSAVIGLGSVWFTTAGLGLWQFGILTALLSFTSLVGNTLKFSTWEAVVKYGADDLMRNDRDALRRLIAFNTLLDIGTALVSLAVCAGLAFVVLPLIKVPSEYLHFALFLSVSAFFTVSATPVGVLRLFDRFGLLAVTEPIGPAVRLILCVLCYKLEWSIWGFGAAYLASSAIDRFITVWFGWRELRRRDLTPGWRDIFARHTDGHPGLWKFVLANNGRTSLGVLTKQSDDMIVAAFTGPAGAALWKIAKQAASVLSGPARMFVISVFPQLAHLWSARDYRGFRRLVVRSSATSTLGAVLVVGVFAVLGPPLLGLFFHKAAQQHFASAYVPALMLMISRVASVAMSPFMPAMTAMGRAVRNLKLALILACISVPTLLVLAWQFGIVGAALSRIFAEVLTAVVFGWTVMHTINTRVRKAEAPAPAPAPAPAALGPRPGPAAAE
ncbi:lipopolysaccharide biosynthesis protein [Vineibacter terrae]|nr:lipopolysaccharide biosynthesis protein [Vineibacter terrae]